MKVIKIYTDGACSGNPGPGGWGAILIYGDIQKEISGFCEATTNNIMELTAVIEALKLLKEKCEIDLFTDSKYVSQGMEEWLPVWKKNNWRTSTKKPLKNLDLWKQLDNLSAFHKVKFYWVKGHADNPFNNRCDELAREEIYKASNNENIRNKVRV